MLISFDPLNPREMEFVRKLFDDPSSPSNSLAEPDVADNNAGTVTSGFLHLSPEGDGGSEGAATGSAAPAVEKAKRGRKPKAAVESEIIMAPAPEAAPTGEPTLDDARAALLAYNQKHGMDAAIDLVRKFGAARISELDASSYGAFIAATKE